MSKLVIPKLQSIETLLLESEKLGDVIRWKKYVDKKEAREETTLEHTFTSSILAIKIIENEKDYSPPFDAAFVLESVILHDLGEIEVKDTVYIDKTEEGDKKEYAFYKNLVGLVEGQVRPLVIERMDKAYKLQTERKKINYDNKKEKHPVEVVLFDAIERYGYILFAYGEYWRQNREKILVQTLRHQYKPLDWIASQLQGFRTDFYTENMQKQIKQFIDSYEGQFIEKKGEK